MGFDVPAESYDRFMGRYSAPLAPRFVDASGLGDATRVLDVGCGPGALTAELVRRYGAPAVAAVDPSESFVLANRVRHPGADVRKATAEHLPFADATFDGALAQLVLPFMSDQIAGLREMARVTRAGGVVAASMWEASNTGPLGVFWRGVMAVDPESSYASERTLRVREGTLADLFALAGLEEISEEPISVDVEHASFDDWWTPFTLGVGAVGELLATLDETAVSRVRESCRELLPPAGPFVLTATAWAARGTPPR